MQIHRFELDVDKADFVREFVSKNRLEYVGSGAYGTVYATGPRSRYVYKIGKVSDYDIDGYLCFLKHVVLKSKNNPYVPKVYGMNIYTYYDEWDRHDRHFYILKMERLVDYESISDRERRAALADHKVHSVEVNSGWGGTDTWLYQMEAYMDGSNREDILEMAASLPQKLGMIFSKCRHLVKHTADIEGDFHDGNIMWRKTGRKLCPVVIDPLC